jgi:hypothetical protein
MNFLLTLAQVGAADSEVDSPLKKFIWFGLLPIGLLVLIFGGGMWLRNLERKDKAERERVRESKG